MANGQIQRYADMANLQVASEAFLRDALLSEVRDLVVEGNTNNSKQPDVIADQFKIIADGGHYKLIAHQDLTLNIDHTVAGALDKSGFSASIFLDTKTGEYTLSIRSTEFAQTIHDSGDISADIDIGTAGWAFGQVHSLEAFWRALAEGTAANGVNAVTIPDADALTAFRAAMGGGGKVNVTGYSLGGNLATAFTELHRSQVAHTYLFNGAGTGKVRQGGGLGDVVARYEAVFANPLAYFPTRASAEDAANSMGDAGDVVGAFWDKYVGNPQAAYENLYLDPRHVLATIAASTMTQGALASGVVMGPTTSAPRVSDGQITDIYAYNYGGSDAWDTATARSGVRHGDTRPIWYEDQPLQQWDDAGEWDFATGHSIVLLQDSLNLMALYEQLDPGITEDRLAAIFGGASAKDYDSLEKALDAISQVLGIQQPVAAATADSQFAQMGLRNALHARIKALQDSNEFAALKGQLRIEPASADLGVGARNNFSYLLALQNLSPVRVTGKDAAGQAALEGILQAQYPDAYAAWQADKSAATPTTFTDQWYDDRSAMLNYVMQANVQNIEGPMNIPGAQGMHYEDIASGKTIDISLPDNVVDKRQIIFGDGAANTLVGKKLSDHLYGGAGADRLYGPSNAAALGCIAKFAINCIFDLPYTAHAKDQLDQRKQAVNGACWRRVA